MLFVNIKLHKMLREDDKLYFIYQYYETSLETHIQTLANNLKGHFTKDHFRVLLAEYKKNIDAIIA